MKKVFLKSLCILLLSVVVLLCFSACSPKIMEAKRVEKHIREELCPTETKMEKTIAKTVKVTAELKDEAQVEVTVKAPDICDELLAWMEKVDDEDFTEQALEEEILRLIGAAEATQSTYVLDYTEDDSEVEVQYTEAFGDALSCGLVRFRAEMLQRIAEEMGGAES